jgi:phospholipid/cholesterol/gamma-HCH transport system substrate-binding protein
VRTQIAWWRRIVAGVAGALCVAALAVTVLLATAAGGSGGSYTVRAIFDDAGNLVSGEDVLIDGVKAGKVGEVVPTPQAKAAVTLEIENPGFQDFREDATCVIRIQSLIGEKDVDCLPTQPRPEGTPLPPPLRKIPSGQEGAGEYLLPVQRTSSPIDVDLLGDINRLPEAQRLTIIINEFGAGLAGRGSDLNVVIRRANPALRELERVLGILASENQTLVKLAEDSDKALTPLAGVKGRVSDFVKQSNIVSRATANQRGALARDLELFPTFLRELGPAMERLGRFAEQTTPTFTDLGIAAPGINKVFQNLGPFSTSSIKFFESLGHTSKTIGPSVVASRAFFKRFQTLGAAAKPFSENSSAFFTSVRETGGIERLVDAIFNGAGVTNGYDALGHFLRGALVVVPTCLSYAVAATPGCNGRFSGAGATTASAHTAGSSATTELVMQRTLAVLRGATPAQAIAEFPGSVGAFGGLTTASETGLDAQPVGGSSGGTTYYSPSSESAGSSASGLLLNYLLGN